MTYMSDFSESARKHHESAQEIVLNDLREYGELVAYEWERDHKSRMGQPIERLRNVHGFLIITEKNPTVYRMPNSKFTMPTKIETTDEIKQLYWKTNHWKVLRRRRFEKDGNHCLRCKGTEELQCHHITYKRLFHEFLGDVMTLCAECHYFLHDNCKLNWPPGIPLDQAKILLPNSKPPNWTLPWHKMTQ